LKRGVPISGSKTHNIAFVLAILFLVSVYFFLSAYGRYIDRRAKVERMTARLELLHRQKNELERKKRVLEHLDRFMATVKGSGLEKTDWTVYEVNIESPETFAAAEEILTQCTNTAAYYFKPVSLSIRMPSETGEAPGTPSGPTTADPRQDLTHSDLHLKLRGAFVAPNN
jgi:hypothetical protein